MTVLADASIRERLSPRHDYPIGVEPLAEDAVQPASVDIRIGTILRVYREPTMATVTVDADWRAVDLNWQHAWTLWPGRAYLATTFEYLRIPADLLCMLHGRSSVARLFVRPHQDAGLLDPGYEGRPTLELTVTLPVELRPLDPIGQLVFHSLDRPAQRPYGHPSRRSRYQGDTEPEPTKEARR